ncbi:GNAT family N-acetyltransferase [Erythrobacter sp. BLCC-B19]|uniref:GNAT family N-acetyltransferase n=1 Tax=Erythrobacter sp. BLCC-B19 TaxID=3025315 RepID=UPI002360678D|nr:GNAT family N-acetyltransferase [Erythrobacter sp. BLCC-B19]WDA42085.1 GNAT family N-acetyltransferase [Erythrobacter sp. BLCC-B19]
MSEDSEALTITHHVAGTGGRYLACLEGASEQGYLEWEAGGTRDGKEVRIAAHTIVPRAIGGRGVAGALVDRLIDDARRQGFLIRPDCSYVARKFAENPDWADLRA